MTTPKNWELNHSRMEILAEQDSQTIKTAVATPEMKKAIENLLTYLTSANDIPVDKAVIKANSKEVLAARAVLEKIK